MSYLEKNLLPDEHIMFRTKKHLIIFTNAIFFTVLSFAASYYMYTNSILANFVWAPWIVAGIFWLYAWLEYQFSDFAVTNKRVMMREGFFTRHTNELRLTTISQVNVNQTLVGQLLNYGDVALNAFGAYDTYTLISKPFLFQQSINVQLDKLVR